MRRQSRNTHVRKAPREARPGPRSVTTERNISSVRLRVWLDQHKQAGLNTLRRIFDRPLAAILTWMAIGVALGLPLTLAGLGQSLERIFGEIDQTPRANVYLQQAATAEQVESIREQIALLPAVNEITLIPADVALAEFTQLTGYGQLLEGLEENPLPVTLVITLANTTSQALQALTEAVTEIDGVDKVVLDLAWLKRLQALSAFFKAVLGAVAMLLSVAIMLVISNAIRVEIFARRDEIQVTKLIGASDSYVRRPFLYDGFLTGLGGGLMGIFFALLALSWLAPTVQTLLSVYIGQTGSAGFPWVYALLALAVATSLGLTGALLATQRHLNSIRPD